MVFASTYCAALDVAVESLGSSYKRGNWIAISKNMAWNMSAGSLSIHFFVQATSLQAAQMQNILSMI